VTFHGDTPDGEREHAIASFIQDPTIRAFLGTDAAARARTSSTAHTISSTSMCPGIPIATSRGTTDRPLRADGAPAIWVLIAADRRRGHGRPEERALEVVVEKLQRIQRNLGRFSPVLPGFSRGRFRRCSLPGGPMRLSRWNEYSMIPSCRGRRSTCRGSLSQCAGDRRSPGLCRSARND